MYHCMLCMNSYQLKHFDTPISRIKQNYLQYGTPYNFCFFNFFQNKVPNENNFSTDMQECQRVLWINKVLFKNYITSNATDSTSFEINS